MNREQKWENKRLCVWFLFHSIILLHRSIEVWLLDSEHADNRTQINTIEISFESVCIRVSEWVCELSMVISAWNALALALTLTHICRMHRRWMYRKAFLHVLQWLFKTKTPNGWRCLANDNKNNNASKCFVLSSLCFFLLLNWIKIKSARENVWMCVHASYGTNTHRHTYTILTLMSNCRQVFYGPFQFVLSAFLFFNSNRFISLRFMGFSFSFSIFSSISFIFYSIVQLMIWFWAICHSTCSKLYWHKGFSSSLFYSLQIKKFKTYLSMAENEMDWLDERKMQLCISNEILYRCFF